MKWMQKNRSGHTVSIQIIIFWISDQENVQSFKYFFLFSWFFFIMNIWGLRTYYI